jgi:translation initiation factor 2 gamma subunit (eIF-2gamma)
MALSTAQVAALAPLATQPISAAALPLPAGAATEATLATLVARTPALGAQNTPASTAVNNAADQVVPMAASGELIEALEAMRYAIQALTRSVGLQTVDAFGRNRVVLDALGGAQTLGTVTSVGTVTNQAQLGGLAVQDQIPALMHLQADNLRRNITVS